MKVEIAEYVAHCDHCSRIKAEHQRPAGLLQPSEIPVWKWEKISMDFIVGLPQTLQGNDAIWVVVDCLTKTAHFTPIKADYRVEFTYNNSYQASLEKSPFEALYGRKCRTPLLWTEVGERTFSGPTSIKEAKENVAKVRENLRITESRQKSYADHRRRDLSFDEGSHVYLKVSPLRGTQRSHVKRKLSPRFVGPFKILRKIGQLAYEVELPKSLDGVHPVFHLSNLQDTLEYLEYPVQTLEKAEKGTRRTKIPICKVLWRNQTAEATWEKEFELREKYPHLFETE
ncbi:hypothetical protein U9M48_013364 [Paspalum notatum var. saurae]|uniref:Tf2-1-like SH3-like domain-containing protein n=1 Tax=Paspalum notatum var. saurae TaxID=547442 RepID=A0AAQ3T0D1_PASNO